MISKPNDTQASEAAWGYSALVWPQECDTKQGCKYSENRVREEEEMEAGGGVLSQSTYGVCRNTAHVNTSTHQDREKATGIVSKHHKDDRKKIKNQGDRVMFHWGPSRGYTASKCKASTCPIRNRSACAGLLSCPPRLLVNIPVICKQTEFTCDYEWIHQILMEAPCKAPCALRMHLHHDTVYTWIHE